MSGADTLRDLADAIASRLEAPSSGGEKGDGGVRDVSNEPRVPAGHGRESGRWTTAHDERLSDFDDDLSNAFTDESSDDSLDLEGGDHSNDNGFDLDGADHSNDTGFDYPSEEIVITGKRKSILTDDQIANIIFNETRALKDGPELRQARIDMATAIMNGDEARGPNRPHTAPDEIKRQLTPDEQAVLDEIRSTIADARRIRDAGGDPTDFSTNYYIPDKRGPNGEVLLPKVFRGRDPKDNLVLKTPHGPFADTHNHTTRYIDIYQDPHATRFKPR